MKYILRLYNPDIVFGKCTEARTVEEYEILIHNVMKGDPGTTDYNDLENKPTLEGVVIEGDKTLDDFGIAAKEDIPTKVSELENDADYISDAPSDDNIYGRENRQWKKTAYEEDLEWGDF